VAQALTLKVRGDTSHARRELKGLSGATDGTAKKLMRLAKMVAGAYAMRQVVRGIGAVVMAASNLEESTNKTREIFKDQADDVIASADRMASKFGIVKTDFLEGASNIGAVGKAMGLTSGEAANMGVHFGELAGDVASFFNVDPTEVLQNVRSGLTGEGEAMKKYGVIINEETTKREALRLGLIKEGEALSESIKLQARASLITKGFADAAGDLERTQGGVANRLREVKGRVVNLAADLGTKLLPTAAKFLGWAADVATKYGPKLANWMEHSMVPAIESFARWLGEVVRNWGPPLKQLFTTLVPPLMRVAQWVGRIVVVLGKFVGESKLARSILLALVGGFLAFKTTLSVVNGVTTAISGMRAAIALTKSGFGAFKILLASFKAGLIALKGGFIALKVVMLAHPFALVAVAVIALVAGIVLLWKRSETFRRIVRAVWAAVKDAISGTWSWLKRNVIDKFVEGYRQLERGGQRMMQNVRNSWQELKDRVSAVYTWLRERVFLPLGRFFTVTLPTAGRTVRDRLAAAWTSIRDRVSAPFLWLRDRVFNPLRDWFRVLLPAAATLVRDRISSAWSSLKEKVAAPFRWIRDRVFTPFRTLIRSTLPGAFKDGATAIGRFFGAIRDKVRTPVEWVIRNVINKLIGGINWILNKAGLKQIPLIKLASGGGGSSGAGGGVTRLHKGGVVGRDGERVPLGRPKADEELALLRKGERVLNVDEARRYNPNQVRHVGGPLEWGLRFGKRLATSAADAIRGFIANTARPVINAALGLLARTPGGKTAIGQGVIGTTRWLSRQVLDWLKGVEKGSPALGGTWSGGSIVSLGRKLQQMGYHVGEHPAFGGVAPVHVPNSYHYRGRALDVNYYPASKEPTKLDQLHSWLRKNVPGLKELIWRAPGHFNHLHLALAKGGLFTRHTRALAEFAERGTPEVVSPVPMLRKIVREEGGGGRPIMVVVELDGRIIARTVGPHLADEIRVRTGMRR
jgi:hypothetical protein